MFCNRFRQFKCNTVVNKKNSQIAPKNVDSGGGAAAYLQP